MQHRNGSATQTRESTVTPEAQTKVTLEAFLQGQRKINGRLCTVDQELLKAIIELKNAVEGVLKIDLTSVNAAIAQANSVSQAIPGIDPPGCDPW
jgi:hypothetical protein